MGQSNNANFGQHRPDGDRSEQQDAKQARVGSPASDQILAWQQLQVSKLDAILLGLENDGGAGELRLCIVTGAWV